MFVMLCDDLQQQAHIDSMLAAQDADFAAKLARGRVSAELDWLARVLRAFVA